MYLVMTEEYQFIDINENFIDACDIAIKYKNSYNLQCNVYNISECWTTKFLEEEKNTTSNYSNIITLNSIKNVKERKIA